MPDTFFFFQGGGSSAGRVKGAGGSCDGGIGHPRRSLGRYLPESKRRDQQQQAQPHRSDTPARALGERDGMEWGTEGGGSCQWFCISHLGFTLEWDNVM